MKLFTLAVHHKQPTQETFDTMGVFTPFISTELWDTSHAPDEIPETVVKTVSFLNSDGIREDRFGIYAITSRRAWELMREICRSQYPNTKLIPDFKKGDFVWSSRSRRKGQVICVDGEYIRIRMDRNADKGMECERIVIATIDGRYIKSEVYDYSGSEYRTLMWERIKAVDYFTEEELSHEEYNKCTVLSFSEPEETISLVKKPRTRTTRRNA